MYHTESLQRIQVTWLHYWNRLEPSLDLLQPRPMPLLPLLNYTIGIRIL